MSLRREGKASITIVGAGNLAAALATSLRAAGYSIDQIVSRGEAGSLHRARKLALEVGASVVAASGAKIQSEIVWFCVPDAEIAQAAKMLAGAADWKGKLALHSSGALGSDELDLLRRRGAGVVSVHPLMTFVRGSRPTLVGVPFAMEGSRQAVNAARAIVRDLYGKPFNIRKQEKKAYHAWGMFASPLLTALLAEGERVAAGAGVSGRSARERMIPILRQTLANYARLGAPESFSGPIARGDIETVRKHLEVLRSAHEAREVYLALARVALRELPVKNRAALKKLLKK